MVSVIAGLAFATDWPQWRGVNRDGQSPDAIALSWNKGGPKQLWRVSTSGAGYASPVIVGDRVYITASKDSDGEWRGMLYALNAKDGSLVWTCDYGPEWKKSYEFARTSPTVYGDNLYLFGGMGQLVCVSRKDGKIVWSVDTIKEFGGQNIVWGLAESPLIVDGKVICQPGGTDTSVVAVDAKTGKMIWKSKGLSDTSSYCSPIFVAEVNQIVTHTKESLVGLDASTGAVLWKTPHKNFRAIHPNTPLILKADKQGYTVVVASGYKYKMECYKISLKDGKWDVAKVWEQPEADVHHHGLLKFGEVIVGAASKGTLCVISPDDGKVLYKVEEVQTPSIMAAPGRVIAYSEKGDVFLLDLQKDKYTICGKLPVDYGEKQHWAHPVIANGVLYIRHGKELAAYAVMK